jgi:hypothetical protein
MPASGGGVAEVEARGKELAGGVLPGSLDAEVDVCDLDGAQLAPSYAGDHDKPHVQRDVVSGSCSMCPLGVPALT